MKLLNLSTSRPRRNLWVQSLSSQRRVLRRVESTHQGVKHSHFYNSRVSDALASSTLCDFKENYRIRSIFNFSWLAFMTWNWPLQGSRGAEGTRHAFLFLCLSDPLALVMCWDCLWWYNIASGLSDSLIFKNMPLTGRRKVRPRVAKGEFLGTFVWPPHTDFFKSSSVLFRATYARIICRSGAFV